jgi:hypothetical protein
VKRLVPRYKSKDDRQAELSQFIAAADALLNHLRSTSRFTDRIPELESCVARARALLADGFVQADLTELSHAVAVLIDCGPRWDPPVQQDPSGRWVLPLWYLELRSFHAPVMALVEAFRVIGFT